MITKAAGPPLGISNSLWRKIEKKHEEANKTLAKNRIHPRHLLAWKVGIFDLKEETAKILRRKIRSPFFSLQGLRERSKTEGSMNQKMNIHIILGWHYCLWLNSFLYLWGLAQENERRNMSVKDQPFLGWSFNGRQSMLSPFTYRIIFIVSL